MKWFTLSAALMICCAGSNSASADLFGLFGHGHNDCCAPAPQCCAPAPKCCAPAPRCCAPAPVCAAPAPVCAAPAPCCAAPTCCDANPCCEEKKCFLHGIFDGLKGLCHHGHNDCCCN